MGLSERTAARLSVVIYTSLALGLALAFALAAPRVAPHDAVARYGGAGWVFLLSLVVLMPTFAPALRRWLASGARLDRSEAMPVFDPATSEGPTARDPVCGMVIPIAQAAGTSRYAGRTVYFCALGCKQRFDRAPEQFTLD